MTTTDGIRYCDFHRTNGAWVPAITAHEGVDLCGPCADYDNQNLRPALAARAVLKALGWNPDPRRRAA